MLHYCLQNPVYHTFNVISCISFDREDFFDCCCLRGWKFILLRVSISKIKGINFFIWKGVFCGMLPVVAGFLTVILLLFILLFLWRWNMYKAASGGKLRQTIAPTESSTAAVFLTSFILCFIVQSTAYFAFDNLILGFRWKRRYAGKNIQKMGECPSGKGYIPNLVWFRVLSGQWFLCFQSNHAPVADLFKDFRDGIKLLVLLEVLTGQKLVSMVTAELILTEFTVVKSDVLA